MKFKRTTKRDGSYSKRTLDFVKKHYERYITRDLYESIYDVYKKPSNEKIRIYEKYLEMYRNCLISKPSITSHNSHRFTISFCLFDEDLRITDFIIVTQDNKYMIEESVIYKYWSETP